MMSRPLWFKGFWQQYWKIIWVSKTISVTSQIDGTKVVVLGSVYLFVCLSIVDCRWWRRNLSQVIATFVLSTSSPYNCLTQTNRNPIFGKCIFLLADGAPSLLLLPLFLFHSLTRSLYLALDFFISLSNSFTLLLFLSLSLSHCISPWSSYLSLFIYSSLFFLNLKTICSPSLNPSLNPSLSIPLFESLSLPFLTLSNCLKLSLSLSFSLFFLSLSYSTSFSPSHK